MVQVLAYGEKLVVDGMEWPLAYVITCPSGPVHAYPGSALSILQGIAIGTTLS